MNCELSSLKKMDLDELKKCELDILLWFDNLCKQYNLQYYIFSGTLLGAVRHHGFIPWDDDIDVAMMREDYEQLLSIHAKDDRYRILSPKSCKTCYIPYAKAIDTYTIIDENTGDGISPSVYIDIFPLDKDLPQKDQRKRRARIIHIRRKLLHYSVNKIHSGNKISVLLKTMIGRVLKLYGSHRLNLSVINEAKKYNGIDTDYVSDLSWGNYCERQVWKKEWFVPAEFEFEKHLFPGPVNYHEVLTTLYGDYMELPPEKCRVPKHELMVYLKTLP